MGVARGSATWALAGLLLVCLAPLGQAQQPGGAVGDQQQYAYRELAAISGTITASTVEAWFTSPVTAGTSQGASMLGFNMAGPDVPTGGTATFTASTLQAVGCTVSAWSVVSETLSSGTGAAGYAFVNLTANDCTGAIQLVVTAGLVPVTLARFIFPFNIHVEPTSFNNAVSQNGTWALTQNGTWNLAVSQTGAWTISDDANGWAIHQDPLTGNVTLAGIPDTQQEIQAIADALTLLRQLGTNITVDILDDTTADGMLTVPTSSINSTTDIENATFNSNTTFPDEYEVRNAISDFWFPILFWGGMLVLCYRKKWTYAFWGAFPGLINVLLPSLFPAPFNEFTTLFMLFVGACVAQLWAERAEQREGTWN